MFTDTRLTWLPTPDANHCISIANWPTKYFTHRQVVWPPVKPSAQIASYSSHCSRSLAVWRLCWHIATSSPLIDIITIRMVTKSAHKWDISFRRKSLHVQRPQEKAAGKVERSRGERNTTWTRQADLDAVDGKEKPSQKTNWLEENCGERKKSF